MHHSRRPLALALGSLLLVTTMSACGAAAGDSGSGSASVSAAASGGFTLYSSMGFAKQAIAAFTAKTGIPVKLVADSGGPLLTKVSAEKANPQWTALWVEGDMAYATLAQSGQLAPYAPQVNYNAVGKTLTPQDHTYAPVSATTMAALLCNAVKVPNPPSQYSELLAEQYKGRIGMNDPSQSGPTYTFVAGIMQQMGGAQQGKDYLTRLKANGLKVFPTNGDTLHALETGQIDCGLVQSSAATGEILNVPATDSFKPVATYLPQSTLLPGVIGISSKATGDAKTDAQKFEDFLLSPEGQQAIISAAPQGASLFWPVVDGANKLDALSPMPTAYQRLDPTLWGPQQADIVNWFSATIK